MDEDKLKKYSQEAFHSQRILVWIIIEFILLVILGSCCFK